MSKNRHKCDLESIDWQPHFYLGGCGETAERIGICKCGRRFRDVYIASCVLDDRTNEEVFLEIRGNDNEGKFKNDY